MSAEDYLYEERAGMMGKITVDIPIFKILCQLGKETGFAYGFLHEYPQIKKLSSIEKIKEIILLMGRTELIEHCDILTRLSGIQGDQRERNSAKGLRANLDGKIYGTNVSTESQP